MSTDVIDLTSAELIEEAFKGGGGRSGGEGSGVKGQAASRLRFIVGLFFTAVPAWGGVWETRGGREKYPQGWC